MGVFDIFKKKKSSDDEFINSLARSEIKVPKEKLHKIKITHKQFLEYSEDRHKNFKTTELLSKKDQVGDPPMVGVIVGYHPHPKDIVTTLTAIVEWPVLKQTEKTFVVNCTCLGRTPTTNNLTYPAEGTWIFFRKIGEGKDEDGKMRTYGIAETVFSPGFYEMIKKGLNKKK